MIRRLAGTSGRFPRAAKCGWPALRATQRLTPHTRCVGTVTAVTKQGTRAETATFFTGVGVRSIHTGSQVGSQVASQDGSRAGSQVASEALADRADRAGTYTITNRSRSHLIIAVIAAVAATYYATSQATSLDGRAGVSVQELQDHDHDESVWVAINGQVYDVTSFLGQHPGGAAIIKKYAGKNALAIFNKFHAPDFPARYLPEEACLGPLLGELEEAPDITESPDQEVWRNNLPPLEQIFTLLDFEYIAHKVLSPLAWCYYSSGAEDEVTMRDNHHAYLRIFFKPRVLVDVQNIDTATTMLGTDTSVPFYVLATAQAKLGHPDGEVLIARACKAHDVIQMISYNASYPLEDIVAAGLGQWFQLYFMAQQQALELLKKAENLGLKALFVTVDTPELGRREKDMKLRAQLELTDKTEKTKETDNQEKTEDKTTQKPERSAKADGPKNSKKDDSKKAKKDDSKKELSADDLNASVVYGRNMAVTWADIEMLKAHSSLPVAVKGVQSVDDIVLAAQNGVKAVVLSNHGGRQLDFSRAPVEVLADAMPVLREKGLDKNIEIYIDGGVRRGSDVLKCLCLGARGVGLGRAFLYANACYGEAGVAKAVALLKEEIRLNMRLLGVSLLLELGPEYLDLRGLHARPYTPGLFDANYEPLSPPKFLHED